MLHDASAHRGGAADRFSAVYRELSPRVLGYLRSHGVDDAEAATDDVSWRFIADSTRSKEGTTACAR